MFDHSDADKLIHSEFTPLAYGALYGPDVDDVNRWLDRGIEIVDSLNAT